MNWQSDQAVSVVTNLEVLFTFVKFFKNVQVTEKCTCVDEFY